MLAKTFIALLDEYFNSANKLGAVKLLRETEGTESLLEAKEHVDEYWFPTDTHQLGTRRKKSPGKNVYDDLTEKGKINIKKYKYQR